MYKITVRNELVTYRKYFIDRKLMPSDGNPYVKPFPFIGFYISDKTLFKNVYNIIFKDVKNDVLTWVHTNNNIFEINLPYLKEIRNHAKKPTKLQNLCKQSLSTRDIYLFKEYVS